MAKNENPPEKKVAEGKKPVEGMSAAKSPNDQSTAAASPSTKSEVKAAVKAETKSAPKAEPKAEPKAPKSVQQAAPSKAAAKSASKTEAADVKTLAVDIGGSGVKVMLLDSAGKPLSDRLRAPTPANSTPEAISAIVAAFAKQLGDFQRVSVGFPGVVRQGTIYTAHNLDPKCIGYPLAAKLSALLGKPVRVANDAVVQGLGAISGKGVELVITLGTGMGSALYIDGVAVPSLELAHHPFHDNRTYEDDLGRRALDKRGPKKWNKRLAEAITLLHNLFYYDHLYIGGGNTRKITLKLPDNVTIISNEQGLLGGIKLWSEDIE
jgi:polyphosphate glucokinase